MKVWYRYVRGTPEYEVPGTWYLVPVTEDLYSLPTTGRYR